MARDAKKKPRSDQPWAFVLMSAVSAIVDPQVDVWEPRKYQTNDGAFKTPVIPNSHRRRHLRGIESQRALVDSALFFSGRRGPHRDRRRDTGQHQCQRFFQLLALIV